MHVVETLVRLKQRKLEELLSEKSRLIRALSEAENSLQDYVMDFEKQVAILTSCDGDIVAAMSGTGYMDHARERIEQCKSLVGKLNAEINDLQLKIVEQNIDLKQHEKIEQYFADRELQKQIVRENKELDDFGVMYAKRKGN